MPTWLLPVLTFAGAAVTAVATVLLWRVTGILAAETRRMANLSSQPHVVATIEPNRWSLIHADLKLENTGNATAYDIQVEFDPPLENGEARSNHGTPLKTLSVLKPGHGIASYITEFAPILDKSYAVTVSWKRSLKDKKRESHSYTLDMSVFKEITQLGASEPLIQIAEVLKKLREDWQWVPRGSRKLNIDVYTAGDRLHERRERDRYDRRRRREAERNATQKAAAESEASIKVADPVDQ